MRKRKIRFLTQSSGAGTILDKFKRKDSGEAKIMEGGGAKIEFSAFLQDRQLRRLIVFSPECVCVCGGGGGVSVVEVLGRYK